MDEDEILRQVDKLVDSVEDDVVAAAEGMGLSVAEIADRMANELKARGLDT